MADPQTITPGAGSAAAIAFAKLAVGVIRLPRNSAFLAAVQRLPAIGAPDRLTTASTPLRTAGSRPDGGSQLISVADLDGRRTSVRTWLPAAVRSADRAVPIRPEAPEIAIRMPASCIGRLPDGCCRVATDRGRTRTRLLPAGS